MSDRLSSILAPADRKKTKGGLITDLIKLSASKIEICDELYLQLCKQLTGKSFLSYLEYFL